MGYFFTKTITSSFDDAIEKAKAELKKEGFGVLTEIDMTATLREKLDVDFQNYRILGACNPTLAYEALQTENKIGTMLPCNVIVQERAEGYIEVTAVDPMASMMAIDNPELTAISDRVRRKLQTVIKNL